MMAEHTPGPWAVIPPDEDCRTWFIGRDRLGAPIGVCPEHIDDGLPYYIAVFGVLMEAERAEANAHLVAAAPDLLAACEAVLLHLNEAPLDYENGVTDPTGTIDEGNVVGWRTHEALVSELEAAITLADTKGEK